MSGRDKVTAKCCLKANNYEIVQNTTRKIV